MSNSYKYIDPDSIYIDSKSGILKNLANITDAEDLLFFESVAVAKRIKEEIIEVRLESEIKPCG